jgi:hypothetical protein
MKHYAKKGLLTLAIVSLVTQGLQAQGLPQNDIDAINQQGIELVQQTASSVDRISERLIVQHLGQEKFDNLVKLAKENGLTLAAGVSSNLSIAQQTAQVRSKSGINGTVTSRTIDSKTMKTSDGQYLVIQFIKITLQENYADGKVDEAKQVGNLYHYTSAEGLKSILTSNSLKTSQENYLGKELQFVSFTRNKNFHNKGQNFNVKTDYRITLDGDKLSSKYKIKPFAYIPGWDYTDNWEYDWLEDEPESVRRDFFNATGEYDEQEERISFKGSNGSIPNIKDYILKVDKVSDLQENFVDTATKLTVLSIIDGKRNLDNDQIRQLFDDNTGGTFYIYTNEEGEYENTKPISRQDAYKYIDYYNARLKKDYKKEEELGADLGVLGVESELQFKQGEFTTDPTVFSSNENYADGKVKGKSRPGRVKRAGASCKGSVTDLRAKAKKYGGEKGKMYHWCANMKGGKK